MPKRKRCRVVVQELDDGDEKLVGGGSGGAEVSSSSAEEDTGSETEIPEGVEGLDEDESSDDDDGSGEGDGGSSDDSEEEEGSGEEIDSEEEEVREKADADSIGITEMDIQFYDPTEPDFHAVKMLLQQYLEDTVWSISPLVELILAQTRVGTTVRVNDETDGSGSRDPCGFISVLNIRQHRKQECIQQICKHVLKKCPKKHEARGAFETALQLDAGPKASLAQATGLLISERYFNLPAQMAPWLNKALFDEVAWATEDEKTKQERDAYKFKQYVVMTKVQRGPVEGDGADEDGAESEDGGQKGTNKQKKKKQKKSKGADANREFKYYKLEDEVFHQMAGSNWFTYRLEPTATGMIVERLVMLIPASSMEDVFSRCQALLETPFEPGGDA
jgi:protein BCP1